VWHDCNSFVCVTWLIHMCAPGALSVLHCVLPRNSLVLQWVAVRCSCGRVLQYLVCRTVYCRVTHSYMWHDSFIHVLQVAPPAPQPPAAAASAGGGGGSSKAHGESGGGDSHADAYYSETVSEMTEATSHMDGTAGRNSQKSALYSFYTVHSVASCFLRMCTLRAGWMVLRAEIFERRVYACFI